MIRIKNLSKEYSNGKMSFLALDNVSLTIDAGEFVAIMGASGSGKSTLLHLLGFLDSPTSGQYYLKGENTATFTDTRYANLRKRFVGFVFQQFHLLARTSSLDNVALPLIYSGKKHLLNEPHKVLESVGLKEKKENYPSELSGGEKQRVAIARALVNDPEIIMADEPTGNLDSQSSKEIMAILTKLNKQGKTIIIVTHDNDIAAYANRTIRIMDGKILSDTKARKTRKKSEKKESLSDQHHLTQTAQIRDYIKQSFQMIRANKVRSFLSMLGIMIGVATVVAMLALGAGAKRSITDSLSRLGTNMITLVPEWKNATVPVRYTERDVQALKKLSLVKRVSPKVSGVVQLIRGNKNLGSSIEGTNEEAAEMRNSSPVHGRYFTKEEIIARAKVAVIGQTVAKELFGEEDPLLKKFKINKISFQVIGVLPSIGGSSWRDRDNVVMIPITTAMYRLLGIKYYRSIDVEIKEADMVAQAEDMIRDVIIRVHNLSGARLKSFRIFNMAEIQETYQKTAGSFNFLLGFIASLSLLVGGIGIMNIMLVSVTERIKEIGLRKAIGATRDDILWQFITEAIIMTVTGGVLGIIVGASLALLLGKVANWIVVITPKSVILATSFSAAIGLVFGIWPAKRAARLDPIEALRYE